MPKKHLGQNFLFDPSILKRIVHLAHLSPHDTVVEIGAGHGRLTKMLAEAANKVIAIELDEELCEKLKPELSGYENIEIVCGNALKYSYEKLGEFRVVANIPYYITTPILFKLFECREHLISITITLQKEVAQRITAKQGGKDYGVLSLMAQYYGEPKLSFIVPKGAFRPVPQVDSAVVHIEIYKQPVIEVKDNALFFRIIKTAFSQRRKMLSNSLKGLLPDIKEALSVAGISPDRRPETLGIEEFAKLSDVINEMQNKTGQT